MAASNLELAFNPNTPSEVLAELAQLSDYENRLVRMGVADNPNTPPEILAKLAKDEDSDVRESAMENPNTPPEILAKLGDKPTDSNKSNRKKKQDIIQRFQDLNWDDMDQDEQFDAEYEYLSPLEDKVLTEMGLWIEPSVQGDRGGVWVYTEGDDETVVDGYDYQDYVNEVIDIALDSKNEADFKQKFSSYVTGLMED